MGARHAVTLRAVARSGSSLVCDQPVRTKLSTRIVRVLFVLDGDVMILLHGFIKKEQKTPKQELDLAKERLKLLKRQK